MCDSVDFIINLFKSCPFTLVLQIKTFFIYSRPCTAVRFVVIVIGALHTNTSATSKLWWQLYSPSNLISQQLLLGCLNLPVSTPWQLIWSLALEWRTSRKLLWRTSQWSLCLEIQELEDSKMENFKKPLLKPCYHLRTTMTIWVAQICKCSLM